MKIQHNPEVVKWSFGDFSKFLNKLQPKITYKLVIYSYLYSKLQRTLDIDS